MPISFSLIIGNHLLPVFFIYGLAFFSLGLAASMQHTEDSTFSLGKYLWSLALFGFLHGLSEWADMFSTLGPSYWTPGGLRIISIVGFYLGLISFAVLLDFGVSAVTSITGSANWSRVSRTVSLAFIVLITMFGLSLGLSEKWLLNSSVATRYLLAVPASLFAAIGFSKHSSLLQSDTPHHVRIRRSMMGMAACLAVYAFVSGCVVPPASFFPASAFNYVTFIHVIGIPVQVFRALCAVCAAVLIHGVLSIFALESKTRLERALEATHQAREALEVRVLERTRELAQVNQTLQFQATHDSLTGLLNRGAIVGILENELARALREHHSVGVILVDVDHFKKINDTQGHSAGDAVLFRAAQRMQACIRNYDSVGRYGGEEFLIVLPGCYSGMATARAEEIRHILSEPSPDPLESPITVSMGVASSFDPTRVEDLLSIVDAALYRAKHGGRNRVESVADSVNQASEFEI